MSRWFYINSQSNHRIILFLDTKIETKSNSITQLSLLSSLCNEVRFSNCTDLIWSFWPLYTRLVDFLINLELFFVCMIYSSQIFKIVWNMAQKNWLQIRLFSNRDFFKRKQTFNFSSSVSTRWYRDLLHKIIVKKHRPKLS